VDLAQPAPPGRRLFWLAQASLALSAATVIGMTLYTRYMERFVEHTTRMYQTTRSAMLDVTGPLSRGDSLAMSSFHVDAARAIARFDTVGDSTSNNPLQFERMRAIRELAGQWAGALRDRPAAAPGIASAIEEKVREFLIAEERLHRFRSTLFHRAQAATAIAVTLELAVVAAILVGYSRKVAKATTEAHARQQRLQEQAARLHEQTLELEISNHELREAAARDERASPDGRVLRE
jgi:hypothetical protein